MKSESFYTIAKRLQEVVDLSEHSYADIARFLDVKKSTVSGYKNGLINPDLDKFRKLCVLLDVSADEMLGIDTQEARNIILGDSKLP